MSEITSPKPFVFVLMPFDSSFQDIYKFGIKEATNEAGGYCERVDEQMYEERILDRIYNQINKADVIIADLSGKNPNVFYETGYAHALEKKVILLTQFSDDIPFDLKHHFHIVYNASISTLKDELIPRLKWYFENPEKKTPQTQQLEFYIENQKIEENASISARGSKETSRYQDAYVNTEIHIRNPSNILFTDFAKVGIIVPDIAYLSSNEFYLSVLPNDSTKKLYISNEPLQEIFPEASLSIDLRINSVGNLIDLPVTVRIFTEIGNVDTTFLLSANA